MSLISAAIRLFRSTGGFGGARPGYKHHGGWLRFISLLKGRGGGGRSRECKCSRTSCESRAQLILWLLFASAHADSSGKAVGTFAFANCVKSRQGFGVETGPCCRAGLPSLRLDLAQCVTSWTKPSSKVTALGTITTARSEIGREALHQSQMWNPQSVPRNV